MSAPLSVPRTPTATRLKTALDQLGLALYPWDGPTGTDPNDPRDLQALADLLDREEDGR